MFFYEKIDSVIFIVLDNSCTFQLACYFPCTISTSRVGALVAVMTICATRALPVLLGAAVMASVALPVPDGGAAVSHGWLLLALHGAPVVTFTETVPPVAVTAARFGAASDGVIISRVGKCSHSDALLAPFQGGKFK